MSEDGDDLGEVVGRIRPGPTTSAPPLFEIVPRRMRRYERDRCQHSAFILDSEWNEVSCGQCGEILDPYSVLMRYAEWWKEFDNRRIGAEEGEKRMEKANLRRMRRLRHATDKHREEIDALLNGWPRLGEIRNASKRIEREINDAKREKIR